VYIRQLLWRRIIVILSNDLYQEMEAEKSWETLPFLVCVDLPYLTMYENVEWTSIMWLRMGGGVSPMADCRRNGSKSSCPTKRGKFLIRKVITSPLIRGFLLLIKKMSILCHQELQFAFYDQAVS
jgi:hypothetical protein